jgi:hypothetical protein
LRRQERVERSEHARASDPVLIHSDRTGASLAMLVSLNEPPDHAVAVTAFAETLAGEFERRGGDIHILFAAFAGLVSACDERVCADCLVALDRAFFSAGSRTMNVGANNDALEADCGGPRRGSEGRSHGSGSLAKSAITRMIMKRSRSTPRVARCGRRPARPISALRVAWVRAVHLRPLKNVRFSNYKLSGATEDASDA